MPRKIAVITGASAGIGLEFARQLAGTHDLLLVARRLDKLEEAAAALRTNTGTTVQVMAVDLADPAGLLQLETRLAADPLLGLLINNAGFGSVNEQFWQQDVEAQDQMLRLHMLATLRLTHAALANMVARNSGAIINLGSVAGFLVRPGTAVYSTTKGWITSFTEAIALDLNRQGSAVRVQALCPGFTYTEFHDVIGVDRTKVAGEKLWLAASDVVRESLQGLKSRELIVIPGWRYRWMVGILSKLPRTLKNAAIRFGSSQT